MEDITMRSIEQSEEVKSKVNKKIYWTLATSLKKETNRNKIIELANKEEKTVSKWLKDYLIKQGVIEPE